MKTKSITWISIWLISLLSIESCKKLELVSLTKLETGAVSEITMTTATMQSSFIDVGDNISSYGHCWSISTNPTLNDFSETIETKPSKGGFTSQLQSLSPNTTYYIRPFVTEDGSTIYGTEVTFTTLAIPLEVIKPDAITEWIIGQEHEITWSDEIEENVKIELLNAGSSITVIIESTPSNGYFKWEVATGLNPGSNYQVKISSINNAEISDIGANFTIKEAASITITVPNNQTNWVKGATQNITWVDNISENVKIELLKGGGFHANIETNTLSDGLIQWIIPTDLSAGTDYQVKITSVNDINLFGLSENFTISNETSTVTDIDGNIYQTVKIGNQWWMAENLKVTKYADGTEIPFIEDKTAWASLVSNNNDKGYCFLNNNLANEKETFGALYTWAAAMNGENSSNSNPSDVQGACPTGWHMPSDDEWNELANYLGGENTAGGKMKSKGNLTNGDGIWTEPNTGATNESGFNGHPGGWCGQGSGEFGGSGDYGRWWSTLENGQTNAWRRGLDYNSEIIQNSGSFEKSGGYSVRCLQGQAKQISVLVPTNLTSWSTEGIYQITWVDYISDNVNIDLYKNGNLSQNIASDIASSGNYEWTIPTTLFAASDYSIRIENATNSSEYHESEQFTISSTSTNIGTVTDIDGNTYNTVKIGNQWWMAENLKVTKYADGTTIPLVTDNTAWMNLNYYDKAYCYFDAGIYGNLYTWAAASGGTSSETNPSGQQGICPAGWHLPSGAEWTELRDYLGGETTAGGKLKETGFTYWASPNTNATNETGFAARPAGWRNSDDGVIYDIGNNTIWWSTSYSTGQCWYLQFDSGSLFNTEYYDGYGLSVRCVQD